MRSEIEILRAERDRAEDNVHRAAKDRDRYRADRDRAEEDRDKLLKDNFFYRDENTRLSGFNDTLSGDNAKLEQRVKSLEAVLKEKMQAEKARAAILEDSTAMTSLQERLNAAQSSNASLRSDLLGVTSAKDAAAAHLRLSEGRVDSLAKELAQIKADLDKRTVNTHENRSLFATTSSEELARCKEDLHQAQLDISEKQNQNVNLSTQLHLMEQANKQQEDKIAQLTRDLAEQARKGEEQSQLPAHSKDDQEKIRSLENNVKELQYQLNATSKALWDSGEVIKIMTGKEVRSANAAQATQNLLRLKADLEQEQSQELQGRDKATEAILESIKQMGYQQSEEGCKLKIKKLEAALKEMREKYEGVLTHWHEYQSHERALVEAVASINQWRKDVESGMSPWVSGGAARAAW